MFASKRLGKELVKLQGPLAPGLTLVSAPDFKEWQMDIRVLDPNPLYLNKIYRLRFRFSQKYPIEAPEVIFLSLPPTSTNTSSFSSTSTSTPSSSIHNSAAAPIDLTSTSQPASNHPTQPPPTQPPLPDNGAREIPIHPHIYSNGIICLDLLGSQGWSPVQNVESIAMSLQSMLTGNTRDERPPGDGDFVRRNVKGPRDIDFIYEDNTV
ncbi:hypothetical protein MMC09_000019 [Bachmanniomyces sp. S44760]|nr:hypothetical protein [Bachmanniomyces sp. S44760]